MAEMIFSDIEQQDIKAISTLPYSWEKLKNKTVLISGGSGLIGSFLIAIFNERNERFGDNISVISLSRHKHKDSKWVKHFVCDVSNTIKIVEPVNFIIHLASNTHPAQYSADPVGTITTNVLGCSNLLNLAKEKKVKRFLLASSVEIYGNGSVNAMDESYCGYIDCNTSRAGYNESKRVSESLCQSYIQQYGIDCVIARFARIFAVDRRDDTKAIAQFIRQAVSGNDIILKSNGNQRFSFCYISDAISGMLKILLDGKNGEAYNISAEDESKTLGDYAKLIASFSGRKVIYDIKNDIGASKAEYALLNCDKLKSLGWNPLFSVSEGLRRVYEISRYLNIKNKS